MPSAHELPPRVSQHASELRLLDEPGLARDYLVLGTTMDEHTSFDCMLACYSRDNAPPAVDFAQLEYGYSDAITRLNNGRIPGGNLASKIAAQAHDRWTAGRALLSLRFAMPLCPTLRVPTV